MNAKAIAASTLDALEKGSYIAPDGSTVEIASLLAACVAGTRCYTPPELGAIRDQMEAQPDAPQPTTFAVVNETTLQGSARLALSGEYQRIGVLNFASAKNPGGGFLRGAQAQEESLARSSGLYPSLQRCPDFYAFHRAQQTCLYSDRMIYSPACPVLRDDRGEWLPQPYLVDFITSPAPNAGAIMRNEPENRQRIEPAIIVRASKIFALAAHRRCDALVLGAWGCGVFHNDPITVAQTFFTFLGPGGRYAAHFRHVLFSVLDTRNGEIYNAFASRFAGLTASGQ